MSGWFNLDPNKLKQLATNTLINAQKRIDQVLDIKDGMPGAENLPISSSSSNIASASASATIAPTDEFFSSFLNDSTEKKASSAPVLFVQDEEQSFSNWNSWGDGNKTSNIVDVSVEEEKNSIADSMICSETTESMIDQRQGQSSASLAESSTITESSSSESAQSIQPSSSVPSSESTIIGPTTENESNRSTDEFSSDQRNVIDSWMNNGESNAIESSQIDDQDLSSCPPAEFPTTSIIDDEMTPTSVISTTNQTSIFDEHENPSATISTDEEGESLAAEQSHSPSHTVSSSNGHETNSKGSSDDGKQTSCASSDIEVISSPSVTSGLALSTTETYDKCRELRDARRPAVREVLIRLPSHSSNLKYHHEPLPMDNIDKTNTSHFDTPAWSTLIDEAATEPSPNYDENDDDEGFRKKSVREIGELKERLELREKAFKKLTDESNDLYRTNEKLKESLVELEQRTTRLTDEFQQTIENLSLKIEEQKQIAVERDQLRKQLTNLQRQMMENSTSSGNTMAVLREKEDQIQQLLAEGEKLSKTQLQHTNIIKKLRSKEKENETLTNSLNSRIDKLTNELEETKKNLQEKEENEKQLKESLRKAEKAAAHYEKECVSIKSLYEDAEEQIRSTKVALENSYREIAELNKTKAASESKVVEATLSAEIVLREEIRLAVEKERVISRQEQDKLQLTIDELRHTIQRSDAQLSRKEQILRQEIADLRQRLQEAESRNEDLTQNISNATRPLLRQIENLQTTYVTQINSLEKTERQLTDRLAEMQTQYALSVEHERVAQETLLETNAKWKLAEAQLSTLKQDKIRLVSEIDVLKIKLNNLEETRQREKSQVDSMQEAFTQQINSLIQEKKQLEIDNEVDKSKYESDLKRMQIVQETLKEQNDFLDSRSTTERSRRSSGGGHDTPTSFVFERSPFVPTAKPTVYESLRNTGAIAVLESLESQLKEKEGEITLLQSEIADLERTRESMARELVNLSTANEKLQKDVENYPILREQFKDLEKRYEALLTMYGEKQEEADELRLDLADVKNLYRAQIDDLMKQNFQTR